jgi:hypothetical protein
MLKEKFTVQRRLTATTLSGFASNRPVPCRARTSLQKAPPLKVLAAAPFLGHRKLFNETKLTYHAYHAFRALFPWAPRRP